MKADVIAPDFSIDAFRTRVAVAERQGDQRETGDFLYNLDIEPFIRANATREAAVLIAVTERDGIAHMVLTKRTDTLRTHSGQIAFPGGRIDEADASPVAAALRECEEETGIAPRHVDVIGQMPTYLSGSGFRIAPVLAVLNPGFTITPNPDEVDRVFDVPLSFVMDSRNHQMGTRRWKDRDHHLWEIPYKDRYIWGVTAGIIRVLYERLYA